jgi:hypothetical protein
MTTGVGTDWQAWQESWDRQQEWYMPDREDRFRIMLDMVEACVGPEPRVLDLACGTGSITARLLARFPNATSTGSTSTPPSSPSPAAPSRATNGSPSSRPTSRTRSGRRAAVRLVRRRPHRHGPPLAAQRTPRGPLRSGRRTRPLRRRLHERRPHDRRHDARGSTRSSTPSATPAWIRPCERRPRLGRVVAARRPGPGPRRADGQALRDLRRPRGRRHALAAWHARVLREKGFGEARAVWCSPSDTLLLALK